MDTKLQEVLISKFTTATGAWWADKPPVTRRWVLAGLILGTVLTTFGVVLETWLEELSSSVPSLPGFVWDVAKAVVVGSVALAAIDDVRAWGAWWRTTQTRMPLLFNTTEELMASVGTGIGGVHELGYISDASRLVLKYEPLTTFFRELAHTEKTSVREPIPWHVVERLWQDALGDRAGSEPGLRSRIVRGHPEKQHTAVAAAATRLTSVLEGLISDASVTRGGLLSLVCVRLRTLPEEVAEVSANLRRCGQNGAAEINQSVAAAIGDTLHLVLLALEVVSKEADTGVPHPRRESGYWRT